jgi:ATP-dependent RNA helicase SUPV3L1/SUV3
VDLALSVSVGLEADNARRLLGSAGFRCDRARTLPEGAQGAPAPDRWHWRPRRPGEAQEKRGERRPGARDAHQPGQREARPAGERQNRPERKPRPERGSKPEAKHDRRPPREPRAMPKPDTGPARAGGAFDKLADLLKG